MPAQIIPWRKRAKKQVETARCCWVCGKLGGSGFTTALRLAGYEMEPGHLGYAHNKCMVRASAEAAAHNKENKP